MATQKITLLDYGMCNMLNVARALEHAGADVYVTEDAKDAVAAERLVVPGVGAFSECMRAVNDLGHGDAIREFVTTGRPMEFGETPGLGILPGRVRMVPATTTRGVAQRVPHIGWNRLIEPEAGRAWSDTLLQSFGSAGPSVYFVHSFAAQPANAGDRLADCDYGGHRLSAMVKRDNVTATQFHPERSGTVGLDMLKEFLSQ
jgi:glutamine amidotransferase